MACGYASPAIRKIPVRCWRQPVTVAVGVRALPSCSPALLPRRPALGVTLLWSRWARSQPVGAGRLRWRAEVLLGPEDCAVPAEASPTRTWGTGPRQARRARRGSRCRVRRRHAHQRSDSRRHRRRILARFEHAGQQEDGLGDRPLSRLRARSATSRVVRLPLPGQAGGNQPRGVRARASPGNYSARGSRPSAHEQDPDAVHARDVAGRVGMSSGHVLHHFGKRERILIETLLLSEEDLAQDRGASPGRFCAPWSAMVRFIDFYLHREPGDAGWSLNSDIRPAATGLRRPRAPCRSVLDRLGRRSADLQQRRPSPARPRGGGTAARGVGAARRGAARRHGDHAQADDPERRRPLFRPGRRPPRPASAGPVRRLLPHRGVPAARRGARHDREFLARAVGRAEQEARCLSLPDSRMVRLPAGTERAVRV